MKKSIGVADAEQVGAKIAYTLQQVMRKESLRDLDKKLRMTVFGQDEAIDTRLPMAVPGGTKEERKPIGSFLFAGPTGSVRRRCVVSLPFSA